MAEKVAGVLRRLSLGGYSMKMYFHRESSYRSWAGGVVTLVAWVLLISYMVVVLNETVSRSNYNISENAYKIDNYELIDFSTMKLKDLNLEVWITAVINKATSTVKGCSDF